MTQILAVTAPEARPGGPPAAAVALPAAAAGPRPPAHVPRPAVTANAERLPVERTWELLCRQFTQATGWQLDLERGTGLLRDAALCCWETTIGDGLSPLGRLRLSAPRVATACSFLQAVDLASGLARVMQSLAESRRRLASRTEEVSTLVNLGMAIPARENLGWSLNQLLRGGVRLTASRSAAFFLLDSSLDRLRLRASFQVESREIPRPTRTILESWCDREALSRGVAHASRADAGDVLLPADIRSALAVAVESETMPLGTLWVYDRRLRVYGERERHVLQSIAAQIATMLERVALLRGDEQHKRIARELEQATQSQPSPIPADLPSDPRYELAAHVASCHELGGDLCEIIPLPHGRVGLAIGDASGHSIAAAMIMAAVRGALRAFPGDERSLPETMRRINEGLYSITRSHQFMSLCYGIFDPASPRLTYINAGHPLPLLLRRGVVTPMCSHGLLLGVLRDTEYGSSSMDLEPGDVLAMYTDGISEARSEKHQMFRTEGIAGVLMQLEHAPAREILQRIWSGVEHHLAGDAPGDDRTLVVLRVGEGR